MTETVRNVLWIMADQLRFDYLSCAGHPHLHTPNIDALAARGVRFDQAYVQSPVCGSSRMSSYTGRYCRSTGVAWNNIPLRVDELTLGDYLKELDMRTVSVGFRLPRLSGGWGLCRDRARGKGKTCEH